MTGPHFDSEGADGAATRPISVAELLAKNGTIGSPSVTTRRRRRRGNSDAVTVAELTGEIPVIREGDDAPSETEPEPDAPVADETPGEPLDTVHWDEPGPRWPESPPHVTPGAGPQRSAYPRPLRKADLSDAELMSPDPADNFTDIEVDVMDTEVRDVEPPAEDSAYVRSFLRGPRSFFGKRRDADVPALDDDREELGDDLDADFGDVLAEDDGGLLDDEVAVDDLAGPEPDDAELTAFDAADPIDLDEDHTEIEADLAEYEEPESLGAAVLRGGVVVLQSMLAVAFGAGLFIAFDRLWQWNNIVALVLSVLVTLGLVTAVQVVRKTVDTTSTLIAVAVGLLITLGPLALLQSG